MADTSTDKEDKKTEEDKVVDNVIELLKGFKTMRGNVNKIVKDLEKILEKIEE
jgi:very-short-patch-repair endonuclease